VPAPKRDGSIAALLQEYGGWVRDHPLAFMFLLAGWTAFYWKIFRFEEDMGAVLVSALAAATTVTGPWGVGAIVRSLSSLFPPRRTNLWIVIIAVVWSALFFLVAELVSDLRSMPRLPH
jgi:hypothetical protein